MEERKGAKCRLFFCIICFVGPPSSEAMIGLYIVVKLVVATGVSGHGTCTM